MFVDQALESPASSEPLAALVAAVDGLATVEACLLDESALADLMVALRREQARLAAAVVRLTGSFDARQTFRSDGSRSAADWIATRCRLPKPQVVAEVRLGRRLRAMPETTAALSEGDISPPHARLLGAMAAHPRTAGAFAEGESLLVGQARSLRFDDFARVCAHWRDAADPDGPEQRRDRDQALRRVDLAPGLDGVGHLDGYLTPEGHVTVRNALDRLERELFEADWAAARAEHGEAATAAVLARSGAQRRHDALVEMATRAMTAPADGKRPRPLVTVMVGYETFAGRVCDLAGGTVVAPGTVAELLGRDDALIERVVFDGPNRIVDVSSARTFRGALRRVLEAKHRRCTHPTCDVPAARCEGDHIVAWSEGGLTTQQNGQLCCGAHNRWRFGRRDEPPRPSPPSRE
jgi:hypothetical protein